MRGQLGDDGVRQNPCNPAQGLKQGRLAQLGWEQLDKLGVTGSSPVPPLTRNPANVRVLSSKSVSAEVCPAPIRSEAEARAGRYVAVMTSPRLVGGVDPAGAIPATCKVCRRGV